MPIKEATVKASVSELIMEKKRYHEMTAKYKISAPKRTVCSFIV